MPGSLIESLYYAPARVSLLQVSNTQANAYIAFKHWFSNDLDDFHANGSRSGEPGHPV
jgi:hypothetical protein